ncbi:MAG: hypothetical protein IPL43_03480 [Micropruina sp.]|nr:hypothetical protein [Micropruina sp.]
MPLPNGEPVLLQGSAATIWMAAVDGDLDEIWAAMDDRPTELEQARDFLNTLLKRGLLEFTEEDR